MLSDKDIEDALKIGRRGAERVLASRDKRLEQREAVLARAERSGAARAVRVESAPAGVAAEVARAFARTAGVLVAEGDSWFNYPLHNVLEELEDQHGYDVESVAHWGDRIEDMAYSPSLDDGGQLREFTRRIEKLLGRGIVPKAILLSGGGNDVAGDELAFLLNHAKSPSPGLNDAILNGVMDRVELSYVTILNAVTTVCKERLGRALPILLHGYAYAIPDGRGMLGGFWVLPGPWLEPSFRAKGYKDEQARKDMIWHLIDRLNEMLARVAQLPAFAAHVRHIDLRETLSKGADYKKDWANELHPTADGFAKVAVEFAKQLAQLP